MKAHGQNPKILIFLINVGAVFFKLGFQFGYVTFQIINFTSKQKFQEAVEN